MSECVREGGRGKGGREEERVGETAERRGVREDKGRGGGTVVQTVHIIHSRL